MQQILSYMRKAIEDYEMIEEGDKIAVALSGGKDSVTMLKALKRLQLFYPKKFELIALTINPGFDFFDEQLLKKICNEIDVPLIIESSHIKEVVFDLRKEKNPCSLCANLRRGMLNTIAKREGCNKIALGHNEDDVLETYLMNLLYAGNMSCFAPVSYMDRSNMTLIRPLIYIPEKEIKRFVKKNDIKVMNKVCPMDGRSNRENMKKFIRKMEIDIPTVKANLYGAIKRSEIPGWKKKR